MLGRLSPSVHGPSGSTGAECSHTPLIYSLLSYPALHTAHRAQQHHPQRRCSFWLCWYKVHASRQTGASPPPIVHYHHLINLLRTIVAVFASCSWGKRSSGILVLQVSAVATNPQLGLAFRKSWAFSTSRQRPANIFRQSSSSGSLFSNDTAGLLSALPELSSSLNVNRTIFRSRGVRLPGCEIAW